MRVVRGRADARWLPSRYNFALFRLYGLMRMEFARPEPADVVLVIDRNQSASETLLVGGWVVLTSAAFVGGTLMQWLSAPVALLLAIPLALGAHQITFSLVGVLLMRRSDNLRVNSAVLLLLTTAAAVYFTRSPSWLRFAGWQFLAGLLLNMLAAVVMLALRNPVRRVEQALGEFSSEL